MRKYTENEIIEVVNELLNQADVCNLICEPEEQENEYLSEARVISGFVHEGISEEYLASVCTEVFEEYFGYTFEVEDFLNVSKFILLNLYE